MEVRKTAHLLIRSSNTARATFASQSRAQSLVQSEPRCQYRLPYRPLLSHRTFSATVRRKNDVDQPARPSGQSDQTPLPTSQNPSATSQGRQANTSPRRGQPKSENSLSDLLTAFSEIAAGPGMGTGTGNKLDVDNMKQFLDPLGNTAYIPQNPIPPPFPVRLGPNLGRTVRVDLGKGTDVAKAFRQLDIAVAKNKVRADSWRQRFHERPGLKRKRLKSEKWRKEFMVGFKGMVAQVKRMKRQGW